MSLLLTGRNSEKLMQMQSQLSQKVPVDILAADITQAKDMHKIIAWIQHKKPELVIHCAGVGCYGPAIELPIELQMQLLQTNIMAAAEITIEAAKMLTQSSKQGVIVNISSAAAFQIYPYFAAYAASKAFINHLSLSLDAELKEKGVRVLTACPGKVATDFFRRAGRADISTSWGMLLPEDVANAIWKLIQKQKKLTIIDWKYRLLTYGSYFLPRAILDFFRN
jgi:short-subunit dehydrogenase